ncbi:MAG TPA: glycosyltransferase [Solirubrobacteraceae bacterium]|nr:glycosyltransferase [Solirubrobacteraceae bacterium]
MGATEDRDCRRWATAAQRHGNGARGLRFIFYANELIGLGQLRRTLALATHLSDRPCSPSSLILTGSPIEPTFQMPPRVDTVKLPGRSRDRSGKQYSARLELDTDELSSMRSSIALAAATSFQPDVAVVDKLPLGHGGELAATLDALKRGSHCKLVLGLRDIEDSPRNVRRKWGPKVRRAIERYYDLILVYGPESTPDAIDCIGQLDLGVPIHHVGYVGTPIPDSGPRDLEGGYLLTTAGGGFDGFRLITTFAEAVRLRPLGCRSVIVTGPLMAPAQRRRIREVTAGLDIEVYELRRDMESVIAGAQAVVSMAGYNTVSELMRARKPALLVPRVGPSEEQLIRAGRLAAAGLQEMIHPKDLTPESLRDGLDRLLHREPLQTISSYEGGTERAAEILARLARNTRADSQTPPSAMPVPIR